MKAQMRKAYERLSYKGNSYVLHQQDHSSLSTSTMDLSFDNSQFNALYDTVDPIPARQNFRRFKSDQKRQDALHNARAARIRAGRNTLRRARPSTSHMIIDIPCGDTKIPAYAPLHYHFSESYPVYFVDNPIEIHVDEEDCKKVHQELLGRNVDPSATYAILEVSYGEATSFVFAPQYFRDSKCYPVYFNDELINPDEDQKECDQVNEEILGDQEIYGFGEWEGNVYVLIE
jgi:hypothetical protein